MFSLIDTMLRDEYIIYVGKGWFKSDPQDEEVMHVLNNDFSTVIIDTDNRGGVCFFKFNQSIMTYLGYERMQ